ncbi:MAG: hypothetical protein H0U66_12560 [Gemmatimonadaceae bacterium]|nr:hypothetical protein [Gemmatimonadaceae bacterium]
MRKLVPTLVFGSTLLVYVAACSRDATGPSVPLGTCTGETFSLSALEGKIVSAVDLPCLSVTPDGGTYLIVPQFATDSAALKAVNFTLTASTGSATRVIAASLKADASFALPDLGKAQREFEFELRKHEQSVAARIRAHRAQSGPLADQVRADLTPPAIGSTRLFQVLADLNGNSFKTDTAILKYVGMHLLIYQSKNAANPPNGFTDSQIASFGNTFDVDLYNIDVQTFGSPSDVDGNGRVIVLLSPVVNHLATAADCRTQGYVAGFFYTGDLEASAHSNDGEIFYALVPDPSAVYSCAHSVANVENITPATFIHEFQHMISFGQRVIVRGGQPQEKWLDEGLSHIAEELGSRFYEHRYPAPLQRTFSYQQFPDSSQGFINGDLYNSYHFLLDPTSTASNDSASVSDWEGVGSLVQRGGAWLFLRWLGDQEDSTVYGKLDQTTRDGLANVEGAAGLPYSTLFGEFALALYTDSLPGIARTSIPPGYRFYSRNLRALYAGLSAHDGTNFPQAFPLAARSLTPGTSRDEAMLPGTADYYILTAGTSGGAVKLTFSPTSGNSFDRALNAQVSVFRCPSAAACPLSVP